MTSEDRTVRPGQAAAGSDYAVVIPTVGRTSLAATLAGLAVGEGPLPAEVIVVHDRPGQSLDVAVPEALTDLVRIVPGPGRGPAAARNLGWRAATATWVAFLDDDVRPLPGWRHALADDLARAADAAGVQGRLDVPLPAHRPLTDWERDVAGLADAAWITADMAYRRAALRAVGGFDERFPAAYREDAELAIRLRRAGHRLIRGCRRSLHPVGPADRWASVRRQRGNADDALLRRLYGPAWRDLGDIPTGSRARHVAVTAAGVAALAALVARRPVAAGAFAGGWLAGTAAFAWQRIAPGTRTRDEVGTMLLTSVVIPPAAVGHWLVGWTRHRGVRAWTSSEGTPRSATRRSGTFVAARSG